MIRSVITGITGFAGRHLAAHLLGEGHEVIGFGREASPLERLGEMAERTQWAQVDLVDAAQTAAAVAAAEPDLVFHLAALASPRQSLAEPYETLRNNVLSTSSVLQACVELDPQPRVLLVTSSEVYGAPTGNALLDESTPFAPSTPYAVSKVTCHYLGRQVWERTGLPVIEARPFNHIGPGQARGFVVPDFASQMAGLASGPQPGVVRVGDLRPVRDFTDVRDIVRGYSALASRGEPGAAYHLCSGHGEQIAHLLRLLLDLAGVEAQIEVEPHLAGHGRESRVVGSYRRAFDAVGWQPTIPLVQTLTEVLMEWAR